MSIYADKKDGKLTGRFRVEVQRGDQRKRGRFNSLEEAQSAEREWLGKLTRGETVGPVEHHTGTGKPTTLQALLDKARKPVWKDTRHGRYATAQVARVVERFGDKKLVDVTTAFIDEVIEWLDGRELSPATINRYMSALSAILTWGAEDGREYVAKVPRFEWQEEDDGRIRVITEDEEYAIYRWLEAAKAPAAVAAFIATAIDTGCRRGELLKAQKEQISNGRLTLWGATTKSGKTRTVPLTPRAREHLAQHLPWTVTRAQLRYWCDKLREGLGLGDDFVLHACRHTCATRLLERGVDIRTVQEWMGHANVTTTQRYLHTTSARLDAAALALVSGSPLVREQIGPRSGEVTKVPNVGERTVREQPLTDHLDEHVA